LGSEEAREGKEVRVVPRSTRATPHLDKLKEFYAAEPARRDAIFPTPTGAQALMSLTVAEALDNHAMEVFEATDNMITESQRQTKAMGEATDKIVGGMKDHRDALEAAAKASDRYAGRLVCATWALVGATILLVIVTGVLVYATLK
jgi:hypothetical protein